MQESPFSYLKRFKESGVENKQDKPIWNIFYPVSEEEIERVEDKLKIVFPSQLRKFYQEIGYGFLAAPKDAPVDYDFCSTNRINSPNMIETLLVEGHASGLISNDTLEMLEPGDLPFFEIGDSSSFMVMKPQSDNPNAVWLDTGLKIEDSFEKFIWRLYYESPGYYGDIIMRHYQK